MSGHYTHDNASASGIALAHTVYGEKVSATGAANSVMEGVAPATWSTAPFKPPKRANEDREFCAEDGCQAYPTVAGQGYCPGHARKRGLMPTCSHLNCGSAPMKGKRHCYYHGPKTEAADVDAG